MCPNRKKKGNREMDEHIFDKIHDVDLKDTMEKSYIDYAMSVIAARCKRWFKAGSKKNTLLYDRA